MLVLSAPHRMKPCLQYNMAGDKFAGMDNEWNYASCCCCISMPGYISLLLLKYKHPQHAKPQLSPYKCLPIAYSAKSHITPDPDALELLNANRKCHIQEIVGSLLYYAQVVYNKLLMALSAIAARQANATVATKQTVNLLLDYVRGDNSKIIQNILLLLLILCVSEPKIYISIR
jgi:hypothetical protein